MPSGGKRKNAGRKPGQSNKLKKELQELITESDVKKALGVLRKKMDKGDTYSATYLLDQKYGKARQRNEISGADGEDLRIEISYTK